MNKLEIGQGIRQGDVYVLKITDGELPDMQKDKAVGTNYALAYGESTGHAHCIAKDDCEVFVANDNLCKLAQKYGVRENMAITHALRIVVDNTRLLHGTPARGFSDPDHTPIELPKGDYIVLRPREYSDEEEFKVIAD